MLNYKTFDVEIERRVTASHLSWPEPGSAGYDSGLGGNRQYMDLRRLTWTEARRVYGVEAKIIARLEASDDPEEELDQIEDELYEEDADHLYGLDIGVASSVIALSAARCVPFASCNAGAFGGRHHEWHPLVAFYARPPAVPQLLECAEDAGAGLGNNDNGALTVYADDIRKIRAFALALMRKSADFRTLRFSPPRQQRNSKSKTGQGQLKLL